MLHTSARGSENLPELKGTAKKWGLIGEDLTSMTTYIYMDSVADSTELAVWHTQKPKDVFDTDEGKAGLMWMPANGGGYKADSQSGYFAVSLGQMYLPNQASTP